MKFRKDYFLFLLLSLLLVMPGFAQGLDKPGEVSFQAVPQTRSQMLAKIKESGKPGFILFTAEWCSACKHMERSTFRQKEVKKIIETRYLPFRIDVDKNPGGELASFYQIHALPAILLLTPAGDLLDILPGYQEAEPFLKELDAALRGSSKLAMLKKSYRDDPGNEAKAMALAKLYADLGSTRDANPIFTKLLSIAKDPQNQVLILFNLGMTAQMENNPEAVGRYFERIIAEFPKFDEMERVIFALAHYYLKSRQPEKGLLLIEKGFAEKTFRQTEIALRVEVELAVAAKKWERALAAIARIKTGDDMDPQTTALFTAHCLLNSKREMEGQSLLDKLYAEAHGNPDKIMELAGRCEMSGIHLALALEWTKKIVAASKLPGWDIRSCYAGLLWKNGHRSEGEQELRQAITLAPDERIQSRLARLLAEWQQESANK